MHRDLVFDDAATLSYLPPGGAQEGHIPLTGIENGNTVDFQKIGAVGFSLPLGKKDRLKVSGTAFRPQGPAGLRVWKQPIGQKSAQNQRRGNQSEPIDCPAGSGRRRGWGSEECLPPDG